MSIKQNRPLSAAPSNNSNNYHSSSYYPYPEPKNTYRLNPLVLGSLKNLDVDDVQEIFSKGIYDQKNSIENQKKTNQKIFDQNDDIKEIKHAIENAKLNEFRAHQIHQNQLLRLQNLIKDTQADETVLDNLKKEMENQKKLDEIKQKERFKAKYLLQEQMAEHEKNKLESIKEYERDKKQVNDLIEKLKQEDIATFNENERKKAINRMYMENAYKEKAERKKKEKEDEKKQQAAERKYFEDKANQENEFNKKKEEIQNLKDIRFNELCNQAAQEAANKEYWENVRNELYLEQENQKNKLAELKEKEKKQRQKEELLASAIKQFKEKEEIKKKEKEMEAQFKKQLMEQYENDEKLEMYNLQMRKLKMLEFKKEIERQWKLKIEQYEAQRNMELKELEEAKRLEEEKRKLIEEEKERLIKENENLLKKYYSKGYQHLIGLLDKNKNFSVENKNNKQPIYNNLIGNSNPNPPSLYPKYGVIKNFVYDINYQDVNHNINRENHLMYNATLNNDYDSYPTQEEYKKFMEKNGQKYYQYAGGPPRPGTSYIRFPKGRTNPMQVIPLESYQTNRPQTPNQNVINKGITQQQQRYIDLAGNGTNNMMGFVPNSQQENYNNVNNNRVQTPLQNNYNYNNNNIKRVPTPQQNNYNFNNNINVVPTQQQNNFNNANYNRNPSVQQNYQQNYQNRISSPSFQNQQVQQQPINQNYFNQNLKSSPIYQNNYQQQQMNNQYNQLNQPSNNRYNNNYNQNSYYQQQRQNPEPIY